MTPTLNILKAYTSKDEQPYTPEIGENYRLTVMYEIKGAPAQKCTAYFTMAGLSIPQEVKKLWVGIHIIDRDFFPFPLDGEIPYKIEMDATFASDGGSSGNPTVKTIEGKFTPRPPTQAIEFYDPQRLIGTQMLEFELEPVLPFQAPSFLDRLVLMMSAASTGGWQKMLGGSAEISSGLGDFTVARTPAIALLPDSTPVQIGEVYYWDQQNEFAGKIIVPSGKVTMWQQYQLEVRNQRVDADQLRKVTWSQMDSTKGINLFKVYTAPEKIIQSQDKRITDFVNATLGPDYRKKLTPYDAARKLFRAVIKRTEYYFPKEGEVDERPKTAIGMLEKQKGDCGGFSILLVACFRNAGLPARTACGAWVGEDAGHCWCEIYFPQHGWMVADGSGGNGWNASETGDYAFCFGSLFDLNGRMAVMRGNTFTVGDIHTSWLQCPLYPHVEGMFKVVNYKTHGTVSLLQAPEPKMAERMISSKSLEHVGCPCREHGGFLIQSSARLAQTAGKG